jgi:Domain of unknown function (DUF4304)
MTRTKTESAAQNEGLQSELRPHLKNLGFRARGSTFNRTTADGLVQVVQVQMGRIDPPGSNSSSKIKDNLYGKCTVNVGVYVPEVAECTGNGDAGAFIREHDCCVRARLGQLGPEHADLWWDLQRLAETSFEIWLRLQRDAMPFFARFESRDAILSEWIHVAKSPYSNRPRIECAIILLKRGRTADAHALLVAQAREAQADSHKQYVCSLANELGLGQIDC